MAKRYRSQSQIRAERNARILFIILSLAVVVSLVLSLLPNN
jgi:hypothetical protein